MTSIFKSDSPSNDHFLDNEKLDALKDHGQISVISEVVNEDHDVGYDFFIKAEKKVFDSDEEAILFRRVLRKTDMRVLPILYGGMFFLWYSFIDYWFLAASYIVSNRWIVRTFVVHFITFN